MKYIKSWTRKLRRIKIYMILSYQILVSNLYQIIPDNMEVSLLQKILFEIQQDLYIPAEDGWWVILSNEEIWMLYEMSLTNHNPENMTYEDI